MKTCIFSHFVGLISRDLECSISLQVLWFMGSISKVAKGERFPCMGSSLHPLTTAQPALCAWVLIVQVKINLPDIWDCKDTVFAACMWPSSCFWLAALCLHASDIRTVQVLSLCTLQLNKYMVWIAFVGSQFARACCNCKYWWEEHQTVLRNANRQVTWWLFSFSNLLVPADVGLGLVRWWLTVNHAMLHSWSPVRVCLLAIYVILAQMQWDYLG